MTLSIITTSNRKQSLIETALSIACQTVKPHEWILVIDKQKDDYNHDLLKAICPFVVIIFEGKLGRARALNLAVEKASNEQLFLLDDDDLIDPKAIEIVSEYLEYDLIYSNYYSLQSNKLVYPLINQLSYCPELLCKNNIIKGIKVFRKSKYKPVPQELIAGIDYHALARIAIEGKVKKINLPLLFYRKQADSISRKRRDHQQQEFKRTRKWIQEKLSSSDYQKQAQEAYVSI